MKNVTENGGDMSKMGWRMLLWSFKVILLQVTDTYENFNF